MKILLANPRGFCAGVDRAIAIVNRALEILGPPIYVRHEVVHNRAVVEDLRQRGAIFTDDVTEIPEGATLINMPFGSTEGANGDNVPKYAGPCPPPGSGTHHYHFTLYALSKETLTVDVSHPMQRSQFEASFASDIIQKVEIIGLYTR